MYLMYVDESGNTGTKCDDPQQPIFTMSGIIVKDDDWFKIDSELSKLKQKLFSTENKDIEIHAALMYNPKRGKNPTKFWADRTKEENWTCLEKVVDFMVELKIIYVPCSIIKSDIKRHLGTDIKVDPYYWALIYHTYYFDKFLYLKYIKRFKNLTEKEDYIITNYRKMNKIYHGSFHKEIDNIGLEKLKDLIKNNIILTDTET